jgi:hypothetical protein
MRLGRLAAALTLCAAPCLSEPLDDAFHRLYNFDFAGAHRILDEYIGKQPSDPLGHAVRASTFLFFELDRLRILEGEFLTDDKKISGDDKLTPDPAIRAKLFASIDKAQQLADARLKTHPNDLPALFSFCLTEGLRTDYMAFVEKKQLRSLFAHKKAQAYAVRILKRDPNFVDAYLTTGLSEYIMGSLPFFVRWIVRFEQVKGSKEQAMSNLKKVADSGRYLGPFARILLSIIHVREKRPQQAMALLAELTRQFPENPLLRKELAKLRSKHAGAGGL